MSQRSTRANNRDIENTRNIEVNRHEENHLIGMIIRYLLAYNRLKTPIHGDQIKKIYFINSTQNYSSIIGKVKKKLNTLFGYELIEVGRLKYILVNRINNPFLQKYLPQKENSERILIFFILSYIFMSSDNNDSCVTEDELWEFLTNIKIIKDNNFQHNYFGNVKRLVTSQFVDQLYLVRCKIDDTENFLYEWGPRANAEVSRRSVLEFMSKVYDGRSIESWPLQYSAMERIENEEIRDDNDSS